MRATQRRAWLAASMHACAMQQKGVSHTTMATADDWASSVIKLHYAELSSILGSFPNVLLSISGELYQESIISLKTKTSINRSGGIDGAHMLLDHVQMKLEQSGSYLPLVIGILRKEEALSDVTRKMEDSSESSWL